MVNYKRRLAVIERQERFLQAVSELGTLRIDDAAKHIGIHQATAYRWLAMDHAFEKRFWLVWKDVERRDYALMRANPEKYRVEKEAARQAHRNRKG